MAAAPQFPSWKADYDAAVALAQRAQLTQFVALCKSATESHNGDVNALLAFGSLLLNFGFLAAARDCFDSGRALAPQELACGVNLANVARELSRPTNASRMYAALLKQMPNNPVLRRNALMCLEYDPQAGNAQRFEQAKAWGMWAEQRVGGPFPRPPPTWSDNQPLRVGYVSADFCQHTVGLLVKDVLAAHDRSRIIPFAYSAGSVQDWVTFAIRTATEYRDVTRLDDHALADLIRKDRIDVLVDLSGHSAGSRLTAFALRPACVQVTWLGYFATTGLACMDAVLLDQWHVADDTQAYFSERILPLQRGRFCYTPVSWAPEVAPAPVSANGFVTFGSFNNTCKYHDDVWRAWARILHRVPNSRLILRWRNFHDAGLRQAVLDAFNAQGIGAQRIELRGAAFHADVLKDYSSVDIALDPFPFTGGLTSCEALWMGVPIITWPQDRVVSRQTYAFLSAVGLPELAAWSCEDYVRIAVELANDRTRLTALRSHLREYMRRSVLCDVGGFVRELEVTYQAFANAVRSSV